MWTAAFYSVLQRFLHRDFALQLEMHVSSRRQHCCGTVQVPCLLSPPTDTHAAARLKSPVRSLPRLSTMLRQDSSALCALFPDCSQCARQPHDESFCDPATTGRLRDGMVQLPMALQGAWPMMPGMGQGSPVYTRWLHQALSATSLKASASPHSVQDLE